MTEKALGANKLLCDNPNYQLERCFFNFKEWFIHNRERLIYDKI